MKHNPIASSLFVALALLLPGSLMGCMDDALAPSHGEEHLAQQLNPHAVLGGIGLANAVETGAEGSAKGSPSAASSATFGFIQGLAAAPNGDILVADLTSGILSVDGDLVAELPGVTDLSPIGHRSSWATVGPDDGETTFEDRGQALYRVSKGTSRLITDLFAFESENNPDCPVNPICTDPEVEAVDSNPYDVQSLGGEAALVVDAAGNDLLRVDNQGNVEVVAVFPPGDPVAVPFPPFEIRPEAVPTSVAVGPDGYYYVGELTGFPAPIGVSSIWRIAPDASNAVCGEPGSACQKMFDGGFTSIIDLEFNEEGTLYVAELDESSWLAYTPGGPTPSGGTISACNVEVPATCSDSPVADGILFLNAITFGKDGSLWATTNFASTTEVIPE